MRLIRSFRAVALAILALSPIACDTPNTKVVLDNHYPPAMTNALVVYHAFWQAVSFTTPTPPSASSDPQDTVAASDNTAYVLLAPGLNVADDGGAPDGTPFIVLQSRHGFSVHVNQTLHIPVDDTTFAGNCAAGSVLTQAQADFISERVFAGDFAGHGYDAATCTLTSRP